MKTYELEKTAQLVIEKLFSLKTNEEVLILYDEKTQEIAEELYEESLKKTSPLLIKTKWEEGEKKEISYLIKKSDVIIDLTKISTWKNKTLRQAVKKEARALIIPEVKKRKFEKLVNIKYKEIQEEGKKLEKKLKKTKLVKIVSQNGTEFSFINNIEKVKDDNFGLAVKKSSISTIPAGEIYTSPLEKTSKGVIVVDSMAGLCKPRTKLFIKKGEVREVEFDDEFRKKIEQTKKAKKITGFGIGLNEKATIGNNSIENRKVKGTCYIKLKNEISPFETPNQGMNAVIIAPTIFFDEEKVMSEGELLI